MKKMKGAAKKGSKASARRGKIAAALAMHKSPMGFGAHK